jgi:pseudouridine kinase
MSGPTWLMLSLTMQEIFSLDREFSPSPENPVLVIGGAGVDLIGRLQGDLMSGTSNPANIRTSYGGVARNVAENLARLGQKSILITAVGDDHNGGQLINQAMEAGVDTSYIVTTTDHPTGSYLGVVNPNGVLQFALDDIKATSALTPEYIRSLYGVFREASLVVLDANLPEDTLRTIFSQARKARIPVCADPTSTSLAGRLLPFLNRLRFITPNSGEAGVLCEQVFEDNQPEDALDAAKFLVGQGVEIVLITLAEFGVVYATSETSGYIPAIRTTIVDPTGAGDALNATVIFSLLNGISLDDAVRLGVTAATLTLRHRGSVIKDLSLEMLYDQLVI